MIWGSKMKKTLRFFSLGSAAVLLTACVGGAGDPFEQDPPYPYSESHPNDETQNVLGGTAIRSNAATGELQMVTLTGTKYHDTRATVVSDGSYTLVDDDGFDRADRISDGHSTLSLRPVFQNYTALRVFDQAYAVNGVRFDSVGILGVLTRPADIPTSGSATYFGRSDVVVVTANEGFSLQGQSIVDADFSGSGSVNVTMDRFVASNMRTGLTTDAPFDAITISDMVMSGNQFSGGTITTLQNSSVIFITGANTVASSQGAFFGYDPALRRSDEVGGMVLVQGDDGIVIGNFLAD